MNIERMISHYFYSLVRQCILYKLLVQTGNLVSEVFEECLGNSRIEMTDLSKYVPSHIYLLAYWCPQVFSAKLLPRPWIPACTVATGLFFPECRTLHRNVGFIFYFLCMKIHQLGVHKQGSSITEVNSYFIFSADTYWDSVIVFPTKLFRIMVVLTFVQNGSWNYYTNITILNFWVILHNHPKVQ